MDQQKLQTRITEILAQIETSSIGDVFSSYDANDKEGNYIKTKLLSQLHRNNRLYPSDEEFKRYIRNEDGCTRFLESGEDLKVFEGISRLESSLELDEIVKYYVIQEEIKYFEGINEDFIESLQYQPRTLDKYASRETKKKYKTHEKELKSIIKQAPKIVAQLKKQLEKMDISTLVANNPQECEKIKEYVDIYLHQNIETMNRFYHKDLSIEQIQEMFNRSIYSELGSSRYQTIRGSISMNTDDHIDWFYRANDNAKAMLKAMQLDKSMPLDEFLVAVRSIMAETEEDIKTEYRTTTLTGDIGAESSHPNYIAEDMEKLKKYYESIEWDSLSKEDLIRYASRISYYFVRIHPFQDGNGRTSRMLLDFILTSHGIESPVLFTGMDSKLKAEEIYASCSETDCKAFEDYVLSQYQKQFNKEKVVKKEPTEIDYDKVERIGVERAREESIVLIGPIGAGKSLLSSELSKRNNLPVITTDIMRHCPKTVEEIRKQRAKIRQDIEYWKKKLASCEDKEKREEIKAKINKMKNDEWVCDRQVQMRTLLPNLPNYDDLGCDTETSNFLRKKFGLLACHYYEKQFENQLLQALSQQIDFACIIDMGGCMSISLDEEYAKLDKQFREIDEQLYLKHFDLTKYSFPLVEEAIKPFKNIVELQLPEDYKTTMQRAGDSELNDLIIQSGQNHQLATRTIQVLGHIKGNKVNWEQVRALCEQIEQPVSHQVETTLTQN